MRLIVHAGVRPSTYRFHRRLALGVPFMDLSLQFGYGMMDHSRALVTAWGGGTVILSPRDLKDEQLKRLGQELRDGGGDVLVDPQFYLPHADHERLTTHAYWPKGYETGTFWTGSELGDLLKSLLDLNLAVGARELILPGEYATRVDDDWLAHQAQLMEEAKAMVGDRLPLRATIALSGEATRTEADIDAVLEAVPTWDVPGVYVVCEHPNGNYLVTDPTWMSNLLDLVAGIRLKKKDVIVGYCNHQMLILAAAGANAITSGTWMNVRSFPPEKFRAQYEDEIRQRTTWFYCPQALSEYKLPFLDIAQKQGLLAKLAPPAAYGTTGAEVLFSGPQPSTQTNTEQAAFRHYLHCLRLQVAGSAAPSFDNAVSIQERTLDGAEALLQELHSAGVTGQMRDFFGDSIDANRAALKVLRSTRGPLLKRSWSTL